MEELLVDRVDGVVTITINRPETKNAMTADMFAGFGDLCRELSADDTVRCVVVTGAGGDFCSGADVSGMGRDDGGEPRPQIRAMRSISATALALHELQHPVVAKVRGVAVGAGMNIALGADLVYAAEDARFSEIFVRRSLSIDFGGSYLLPRLVGLHKAKEMTLLGDIFSGADLAAMNVINAAVPDENLDDRVAGVVARLAAGPPLAMALSKKLLNNGSSSSMAQALEAEGAAQSVNFSTSDTRESIRAFVEKRDPKYRGR